MSSQNWVLDPTRHTNGRNDRIILQREFWTSGAFSVFQMVAGCDEMDGCLPFEWTEEVECRSEVWAAVPRMLKKRPLNDPRTSQRFSR